MLRRKLQQGINVIGYLRAESGVGEVARAVVRALAHVQYPVAQVDLGPVSWTRAEASPVLDVPFGHPYGINLLCVNADTVSAIRNQLGSRFFWGKYTIGLWHWETANFPQQWQGAFTHVQEVWVTSGFVQRSVALQSPVPVIRVALATNAMSINYRQRKLLGLSEDTFIFFFCFDMQSYFQRKNPYAVIKAFQLAFEGTSASVQLVIKANNVANFPKEAAILREALTQVGGILLEQHTDRETLAALFTMTDAYVSLHRSEGFGLTIAEAMHFGKPVIATAYSGNMEYMTPFNSYGVDFDLIDIAQNDGPYSTTDTWADPNLKHAASLMRFVVEHPNDAVEKGRRATQDMNLGHSSKAAADSMIQRLQVILSFK